MNKIFLSILIFLSFGWVLYWWTNVRTFDNVVIIDDGVDKFVSKASAGTVCNLIKDIGIELHENDKVSPECSVSVSNDLVIEIKRKKDIKIVKSNNTKEITVFGIKSLKDVLLENNISFDDDDILSKDLDYVLKDGDTINITDVKKETVDELKNIDYKKIVKKDEDKFTDYKQITQKGKLGSKKISYEVVYHNGEEFSKKIISEQIISNPIDEILVVGTMKKYASLGKIHTGKASWYANKNCNCAANPWLPMGSRVKVTNLSNGKSIIVKITDRGPFTGGRIIDLDKYAFKKIASLGVGVINVKMQEIIE